MIWWLNISLNYNVHLRSADNITSSYHNKIDFRFLLPASLFCSVYKCSKLQSVLITIVSNTGISSLASISPPSDWSAPWVLPSDWLTSVTTQLIHLVGVCPSLTRRPREWLLSSSLFLQLSKWTLWHFVYTQAILFFWKLNNHTS